MKRRLLRSNAFVRATRRMLRKHPQAAEDVQAALELLTEDAFHPQLRTHKLKGKLEGSWACVQATISESFLRLSHTKVPKLSCYRQLERTKKCTEALAPAEPATAADGGPAVLHGLVG